VNRNQGWGVQNILFCRGVAISCSPVHFDGFWTVLSSFWLFSVIYFIIYFLLSNEEVNIYEEYDDSMRQFALWRVNK